jgi:23S rRNA (adenine2503-C2)-methyltransferase
MSRPLNDLSYAELCAPVLAAGGAEEDARKLFSALYLPGSEETLPQVPCVRRSARDWAMAQPIGRLEVLERRKADDGFVKYLFSSPLGGEFEAVRIPIFESKHVVCISSQIGCSLGCAFCATGRMGFRRNLETWEMVEQVRLVRDEADLPVRHVVFMGMGEPLLNYDAVLRAAHLLSHPGGIQVSSSKITISTAGIVPGIRRYTAEGQPFRLTFSLTSAIHEKRQLLMPIERKYPLPELVDAIRAYAQASRERVMLAYVMVAGLNTGREDVEALKRAFEGIPIKLDLIDVADSSGRFTAPSAEELSRFRDELQALASPIARRYSGGKDICASCGTLAATRSGGTVVERDGQKRQASGE